MKWLVVFLSLAGASVTSYAQNLQPNDSCAVVNVSVIDFGKVPIPGEEISFISQKDHRIFSGTTDTGGKFHLLVPKDAIYDVHYVKFTTDADYQHTLTIPKAQGQLFTANYTVRVQLPEKYTLNNVFFDIGKASLTDDSYKELNRLAVFLKAQRSMVLEIAGYTDNAGTDEANQKLSQDRAAAILNYLVQAGVTDAIKMTAKGYGSSDPVATNDTPEGRKLNRRTEIHIVRE